MTSKPGPPPRPRRRSGLEIAEPQVSPTPTAQDQVAANAEAEPQPTPSPQAAPKNKVAGSGGPVFSRLKRPSRPSSGSQKAAASATPAPKKAQPKPASDGAVRIDFRERNKERTVAKWRLIAHRLLIALLSLAGVTAVVWAVFFSPLLALNPAKIQIETEQSGALDPVVRSIVETRVGTPLPRLSVASIEEEVSALPSVISAKVTKAWPSGVNVQVVKRAPEAMLKTAQGYALVGEDGVTVEVVTDPVEGLPLITTTATDEDDTEEEAALGVAVWGALPDDIREQVSGITVNGSAVSLDLSSGATVVWGTSEDSDIKAQVLALLMEQAPAQVYDLRDPRRPTTS